MASRYDSLLRGTEFQVPAPLRPEEDHVYHLYVVRLRLERIRASHREVFDGLRARGIGVNLHYIPVHTQPYYRQFGFKDGDFPESERYYAEAISLPMYPGLDEGLQDQVVTALRDVLKGKE